MTDDTKKLRQHHANDLRTGRNFDSSELFESREISEIIHHATEIVDAIRVRNERVPALPLAHLLRATMMEANLRHRVHDFFAS